MKFGIYTLLRTLRTWYTVSHIFSGSREVIDGHTETRKHAEKLVDHVNQSYPDERDKPRLHIYVTTHTVREIAIPLTIAKIK